MSFIQKAGLVLALATAAFNAKAEEKAAPIAAEATSALDMSEGPGRRGGLGAVLAKAIKFKSKSDRQRQWLMSSPKKNKHLKRGGKPPVCAGNGGKY